jgi:hypothetical protein
MENFEAQLQAQFDQQAEIEPQTLASQSATDSAQLMASRLPQQHQRKYSQQPQHQHQHQQHQQNDRVGHTQSPNLQPQPAKPQAISSPSAPQQQARTPQSHYNQYRASSSQFQQHQQQKQQTQDYVSSQAEHPQQQQQQQHQFSGGQQHSQSGQVPSAQQYSASTSQQQQYGSNQQPYTSSQQQYPSGQQNLTSQQRYQHQVATTSSPGAASYTTHQSPQFGASSSNFSTADGSYRGSATALSNPSYNQRSQSGSASFRSASTHGLPQHSGSPPFGTGNAGLQQRSASTSQPTSQSMQGLTNVQAFTGNAAADWSLFDTSHLDTSGQQGAMGLSNASYGLGAAGVRASSNAGPAFAATGLAAFDASGLGSSERYYGVGRR